LNIKHDSLTPLDSGNIKKKSAKCQCQQFDNKKDDIAQSCLFPKNFVGKV
jgi:hypothetical protein